MTTLTSRDRDLFLALLDEPAQANAALGRAARRHRDLIECSEQVAPVAFAIERLTKRHDREAFDCGDADLNRFRRRFARQNQTRGYGRTYVAFRPSDVRVAGFDTIASGSIVSDVLPEDVRGRPPRYRVPLVHLARLGLDRTVQGQGIAPALLFDAPARSLRVADELGLAAVAVVAKHDRVREFYLHHGFNALGHGAMHLYLPLTVVRKLTC